MKTAKDIYDFLMGSPEYEKYKGTSPKLFADVPVEVFPVQFLELRKAEQGNRDFGLNVFFDLRKGTLDIIDRE